MENYAYYDEKDEHLRVITSNELSSISFFLTTIHRLGGMSDNQSEASRYAGQ